MDKGPQAMSDTREISNRDEEKVCEKPNALQQEAAHSLSSRLNNVEDRAVLLDTRTSQPTGTCLGPTDTKQEITSTVIVRYRD